MDSLLRTENGHESGESIGNNTQVNFFFTVQGIFNMLTIMYLKFYMSSKIVIETVIVFYNRRLLILIQENLSRFPQNTTLQKRILKVLLKVLYK